MSIVVTPSAVRFLRHAGYVAAEAPEVLTADALLSQLDSIAREFERLHNQSNGPMQGGYREMAAVVSKASMEANRIWRDVSG